MAASTALAATNEPSAFFPPLSSLLSGTTRLLSFHTAHRLFTLSPRFAADSDALERFCYDAQTFNLLSSCPSPLPKPSAQSKSDFEARTAPIQVNGSQNGEYDLEQMKRDAVELSKEVEVEEVWALRVVVLEWQSRAEEELLRGDGEDARGAVELGASVMGKSTNGFGRSVNGAGRPAMDFMDEKVRRRRQLEIFLQERSGRLRLGADLLSYHAWRETPETNETWMDDVADQLFKDRFRPDNSKATDEVFEKCMSAFDEALTVLDNTTKLPKLAQESEETVLMYVSTTFNDIVTILRLMLVACQARNEPPSAGMVSSWFTKMESLNFFLTLAPSPAWPDTTELQCLISLMSFIILDAPGTLSQLRASLEPSSSGVSYPKLDTGRYYEDEKCVRDVNLTLYRTAMNGMSILSPAVFAWAAITTLIRNAAKLHTDMRERMLEDASSDNEAGGRRRSSRRDSREEMSLFEKLYNSLRDVEMEPEVKDDPPAWFATYAAESVFGVVAQLSLSAQSRYAGFSGSTQHIARSHLLSLLREGLELTFYGGEMLEAILALLSPDSSSNSNQSNDSNARLCARFMDDDLFRREIIDQALKRYPFELSPVLRLLAALSTTPQASHDVVSLLEGLQSVTIMVPEHFNDYTLENEEDNLNEIQILEDLPLFVSRQALSLYGSNHIPRQALMDGTVGDAERGLRARLVPAGTIATVLKEDRPMVFKLQHAHSGLEYLGLLLSTRLPNSEVVVTMHQASLDLVTAADIVTLMNALLKPNVGETDNVDQAKFVLERMSDALPEENDIITVIAELFESELISHLDQTAQDGSLDLLVACAEFFAMLVRIEPGRTWTTLAQSSLLGLNGGTNALAAVVGATETALGQFRFLSACVEIFNNLIDDTVCGLVKRRPVEKPANTKRARFDSPMDAGEYTPERSMQKVLGAFTGVMLEAWDSLADWKFAVQEEKTGVSRRICEGFKRLVEVGYGLKEDELRSDMEMDGGKKGGLAASMVPAADAVLGYFAPATANATTTRGFLSAFAESAAVLSAPQAASGAGAGQVDLVATLTELLTSLLRTARLTDDSGKRAKGLATQLLKTVPDLAIIFTSQIPLDGAIAALLAEIIIALQGTDEQSNPPSLLRSLSTSTAKAFLAVLSQLDRSLRDFATEQSIWHFLSAVMRGRQQWLALYLLTGSMPRERLDESSTSKAKVNAKSLLNHALDQLSSSPELPLEDSNALLTFVSTAQGASIWASSEVRAHPNFLRNLIDWLDNLKPLQQKTSNVAEQLLLAHEARKESLTCEVVAQAVHASVEVGDKSVLKLLNGKLRFLTARGGAVDGYNRSLHLNLNDNFRQRMSGLEVAAFARSAANPAPNYGKDWVYDVQLMDRALGHERAWTGMMNVRSQANGFRDEVARANVNLSLVDAQKNLLRGWSALATTIAENLGSGSGAVDEETRHDLANALARTVENGLEANAQADVDVPGTDEVIMARAEMSFVLLSKLTASPEMVRWSGLKEVLPVANRALLRSPADFDVAVKEEDLQYYRLGLQVLYLALQPHIPPSPDAGASTKANGNGNGKATDETPASSLSPAVAGVLLDIFTRTIAPAWRALAGNLHTNIATALPADFALITAILQALLAVPEAGAVHVQIAEVVASLQLARSALSLYSWSDRLACREGADNDPLYGELAIRFLQVLSTVKPVAEHLALEGALASLSSANLSSYFRKAGGKGPFDEPRRMFTIWAEGMLPLCLNLLDAVGPAVVGEVSGFLNSFPLQLERANGALENREPSKFHPHAGAVTLGLLREANSLCLISMILESDTARAAAEGIDAAAVGGGLRGYEYKKVLEEAAGLVRQKASLASRITPVNGIEAEWASRMVDGVDSWLSAKIIGEVKELAGMGGGEGGGE